MKLLFCIVCNDIFALDLEKRECKCKQCSGKYVDQRNITYTGPGKVLGINNTKFFNALSIVNVLPNIEVGLFFIKDDHETINKI